MLDKQKLLADIKALSKIGGAEDDGVLMIVIEIMVDAVKEHIGCRGELSDRLQNVMVQICIDELKQNEYGIAAFKKSDIKSIKRGDTDISYVEQKKADPADVIARFDRSLAPFKKVRTK